MMTSVSPLLPLFTAIESALVADMTLAPLLNGEKVYPGRLTDKSVLDYLTIVTPTERAFNLFNRKGSTGQLQIDIWSADFQNALQIFNEMKRILDDKILPLDSHTLISGWVNLIGITPDPSDDTIYHGIVHYEWTTLRGAS